MTKRRAVKIKKLASGRKRTAVVSNAMDEGASNTLKQLQKNVSSWTRRSASVDRSVGVVKPKS